MAPPYLQSCSSLPCVALLSLRCHDISFRLVPAPSNGICCAAKFGLSCAQVGALSAKYRWIRLHLGCFSVGGSTRRQSPRIARRQLEEGARGGQREAGVLTACGGMTPPAALEEERLSKPEEWARACKCTAESEATATTRIEMQTTCKHLGRQIKPKHSEEHSMRSNDRESEERSASEVRHLGRKHVGGRASYPKEAGSGVDACACGDQRSTAGRVSNQGWAAAAKVGPARPNTVRAAPIRVEPCSTHSGPQSHDVVVGRAQSNVAWFRLKAGCLGPKPSHFALLLGGRGQS